MRRRERQVEDESEPYGEEAEQLELVAAIAAIAQFPVPSPLGECTVNAIVYEDSIQQSKCRLPGRVLFVPPSLCDAYATSGWEETMTLYLGEGAAEYCDLIERAAEVLSNTVNIGWQVPLIKIVSSRPKTYDLPRGFWMDPPKYGRTNLEDNQSVIYFGPSSEDRRGHWGTTWFERTSKMLEADVYVNTYFEERYPRDTLYITSKIADVDASHGVYSSHNRTFEVILHELGHAIGLNHIPVSGNVMSRYFNGGGVGQWAGPIALELFDTVNRRSHPFVERNDCVSYLMRVGSGNSEYRKVIDFFTENAKLGEQEKMALSCIYQY